MKWVYILQCEDGYFYVGETARLYRRFWEHQSGRGGINTELFNPEQIVAIYKVNTVGKFIDYNNYISQINDGTWYESYNSLKLINFNDICENEDQYDNLEAETYITECLMSHNKETWEKIRGGKYTRFDIKYKFPDNNYIKDLPLCKCGFPCDIKKNEEKNYLFFRCAKKNMWNKFKQNFKIYDEPCNFFMEYIKDKQLKIIEKKRFEDRKKHLKKLFKKSHWLENVEVNNQKYQQCIGGCGRTSTSIKLTYYNKKRNLCFDCFINKNDEIAKKYRKCMINL